MRNPAGSGTGADATMASIASTAVWVSASMALVPPYSGPSNLAAAVNPTKPASPRRQAGRDAAVASARSALDQEENVGRLDDKVAVISGASSGIGRATLELFGREG